jgi:hypothetical protein
MKKNKRCASIQSVRHQYVYQRTKSAWISKSLEEYLDVNVIPCANGTDALQITMMGLDLNLAMRWSLPILLLQLLLK